MLRKFFYIFCWIAWLASPVQAATLNVACAANFTSAMKELSTQFAKTNGHQINCTFGSTGMLYGQIIKGAPYDLFFAADEKRPGLLYKNGHSTAPTRYAQGKVVVWSKSAKLASMPNWKEVILCSDCKRVGIANPKTAPYGQVAETAMDTANMMGAVKPRLAYGKSVGTSFQYAYTGAADASFVALSQALSENGMAGHYWPVPEAPLVSQSACILNTDNTDLASKFMAWLDTPQARTIIKKYGYE